MKSTLAPTFKYRSSTFKEGVLFSAEYDLAVEELLEIYVDGVPYSVTMRLPGDDTNLVIGFCFTEGVIESVRDLAAVTPCEGSLAGKRIFVHLKEDVHQKKTSYLQRAAFLNQSSCGLCGKSNAEEVFLDITPINRFNKITLGGILNLKETFEVRQTFYTLTGSTHSAALFDDDKHLVAFAEDVGRHNALDKAIGRWICSGHDSRAFLGIVSSRLSFEMVQKAGVLGLQVLCGLSGPTGKAVELAEQLNMTLIGFLREASMTIYTRPERIASG